MALCRHVTTGRSGVLVSVLAHAAALLALILAKQSVSPPPRIQVIEVSLVMADPAVVALPHRPPMGAAADRGQRDGASLTESSDAVPRRRPEQPNWIASTNSALGRMLAMSRLYAALYGKAEIDWGMSAGALDCLALDNGAHDVASSVAVKQQTCKAKLVTAAGSARRPSRDKNYDPIEPTSPHNVDWVPVLADWDILLGQMSR
jgi:hypothetical protein